VKRPPFPAWLRAHPSDRRGSLWLALVLLVAGLLVMLVWLAGRYEISQVQERLERDTADAVSDIRSALTRNVQALQSLYAGSPTPGSWSVDAASMLHEHREWSRLEWRDPGLALLAGVDSPFRAPVFDRMGRDNARADIAQACLTARKYNGPAYSASYFVPQIRWPGRGGHGAVHAPGGGRAKSRGYLVATYSLQEILSEMVAQAY
jgi:two-component system sensor histidine kinase DctS